MREEDYRETASGDSGEADAAGPAPGGVSDGGSGPGELAAPANPFAAVRARTLILWMLLAYPGLLLITILGGHLTGADMESQAFRFLGDYAPLSIAMVTWVLWAARRNSVRISRLVGRVPAGYNWLSALGILLVAMVFSLGSAGVIEYVVSLFAPGHIEWVMGSKMVPDAESGLLYTVMWCLAVVAIAPTVEEALFRSMLINRWGTRWRLSTAVIASSLFFGVIHLTFFVGPAMLGMILAVMYIRSRSLIVPVVVHAANNFIAVALGFWVEAGAELEDQAVEGPAEPLTGAAMMAVTLPILIWYLRRNWPAPDAAIPYMAEVAAGPPDPEVLRRGDEPGGLG